MIQIREKEDNRDKVLFGMMKLGAKIVYDDYLVFGFNTESEFISYLTKLKNKKLIYYCKEELKLDTATIYKYYYSLYNDNEVKQSNEATDTIIELLDYRYMVKRDVGKSKDWETLINKI